MINDANWVVVAGYLGMYRHPRAKRAHADAFDSAYSDVVRAHTQYLLTHATTDSQDITAIVRDQQHRSSAHMAILDTAIAAGELPPLPRRDQFQGLPTMARYTRTGARYEELTLAVLSPYAEPFSLRLHLVPSVEGGTLVSQPAALGQPFMIEGTLVASSYLDGRYANPHDPNDYGQRMPTMRLQVQRVREATRDEVAAGSAVWLTGTIAEPPVFFRHPDYPDATLMRTRLAVSYRVHQGVNAFGRAASMVMTHLPIIAPVSLPDVEHCYRVGNTIRVEGMLDCRVEELRGQHIRERLATLDQDWKQRQEQRAPARTDDVADERHLRWRRSLGSYARMAVYATQIIPQAGSQPITREVALRSREAYTAQRRGRATGDPTPATETTPTARQPRPRRMVAVDADRAHDPALTLVDLGVDDSGVVPTAQVD